MNDRGGFYLMHRGWLDHPALSGGQFCARARWADMIEMAAWRSHRRNINGKVIELARGEFTASIRFLATRWGVGKGVVERFIARLKSETMIETRTETGQLIIRICNYDRFQSAPADAETANETRSETVAGQERDRSGTNKKESKEGNKGINLSLFEAPAQRPFELKAEVFRSGKAYLSKHGITPKQAGSLLGMWRRDHGDGAVIDALARAEAEVVSEPIAYITKLLGNSNGKHHAQRHNENRPGGHRAGNALAAAADLVAGSQGVDRSGEEGE